MRLLLKSGTVIIDNSCDVATWKEALADPDRIITYSTDEDGLIIFRSSEIAEIRFTAENVEKSMIIT
jgi:hypothetical protein